MSASFPYWSLAKALDVPYAKVLSVVEFMEGNQRAMMYWLYLDGGSYSDLHWRVARAVSSERERRIKEHGHV